MKKLTLLLLFFSSVGYPCTSFLNSASGRNVMAKNFDWSLDQGLIIVNRNMQKIALTSTETDKPLIWTSKYGSVTFNQVGRELPYGGMNEKGLSVETLWLEETEYPDLVSGIQTINGPQWVQAILDQAATVDEVAELAKKFQVHASHGKTHYFVCDATGACAVIEYLKKTLFVTILPSNKDIKVITNDPYKVSLARLKEYEGFGGERAMPKDDSSLSRFVRTVKQLREPKEIPLVDGTFKVLEKSQNPNTQWSIVYDPARSQIFFKTKKQRAVKQIDLSSFDWSCHTAVKVLDINTTMKANVSSSFEDYSDAINNDLVEKNSLIPEKSWKGVEKAPTLNHCG